jgi:hypothetical protein
MTTITKKKLFFSQTTCTKIKYLQCGNIQDQKTIRHLREALKIEKTKKMMNFVSI